MKTKKITAIAVTAAIYFLLSIAPFSFTELQFRLSEALTILPMFYIGNVWGITIGCFLANIIFSPLAVYDAIIGSAITLVAGLMTYYIKNPYLAALPPVLLNAFGLPIMWYYLGGSTAYWLNVGMLLLTQSAVIYLVGIPLYYAVKKLGIFEGFKISGMKFKKVCRKDDSFKE